MLKLPETARAKLLKEVHQLIRRGEISKASARELRALSAGKGRDNRTGAGTFPAVALPDQAFEQSSHPVEIGNTILDERELVFGQLASRAAVLPILEKEQPLHFFQREAELLGAFDEVQPRDRPGTVTAHGPGLARRLLDQSEALVVANCLLVDARLRGDLTNGEIVYLSLLLCLTL